MAPRSQYSALSTPRAGSTFSNSFNKSSTTISADAEPLHTVANASDKPRVVALSELYRFATPVDKWCLTIGVVVAGASGALYPCMALIFGDAITAFAQADGGVDRDAINSAALYYLLLAIGMFVTDYAAYVLFSHSAERQMKALRAQVLRQLLYLDVGWYDSHDPQAVASRLTGDTVKIKDGMGQKLGEAVKFAAQFVAGYAIGFAKGWDSTLVMSGLMPVLVASLGFLLNTMRKQSAYAQELYAEAGAIAEETLGTIRTVAALNGQQRAIARYTERTKAAERSNISLARTAAAVFGMFMASIWFMYAAGLWYGGSKVVHGSATPAEVFQSFFGVMMGTMSLAQISPNIGAIAAAKGAASALYQILDTISAINASKDEGVTPETCNGRVDAVGLNFTYPSRPDARILKDYNVTIDAGQTVAFVGPSGGGKSTLISLLERFYDPQEGEIMLDGRDIKTLNVKWLRSQIGLVSQEPVLFATSIFENIAAGEREITREQVIAAAKLANAHTFIMSLPEQYDTLVGEKGVSLSGGQKQRVAIARALVREPKILVLDEATSALDAESERVVQAALNDLMDKTKMTTLVIAHRLSTIRKADKIVVVSGGHVVEQGTHDELVSIEDGVYLNMYELQEGSKEVEGRTTRSNANFCDDLPSSKLEMIPESCIDGRNSSDRDQTVNERDGFSMWYAFSFNKSFPRHFAAGIIAAAACGASIPLSAVLESSMVASMTSQYANFEVHHLQSAMDALAHDITVYGVGYIAGAVGLFVATTVQNFCFRFLAEKITTDLRTTHFRALCRQDTAFFDEKQHATGALTADLSTHASKVGNLSGDSQGRLVSAVFTLTAALIISFTTGSWLLTCVMLVVAPFLVLGHTLRIREFVKASNLSDELGEVGAHASEALTNIRTVTAFGLEQPISRQFNELLTQPMASGVREAHWNGAVLGFSSFIVLSTYALVFWYGGKLVDDRSISFSELMRTLLAIMMASQGIGTAMSFLGDSANAVRAGKMITQIRDRQPAIDWFSDGGRRFSEVEGHIEFKDVTFQYPTWPEVTVLRDYNVVIEAGQTVAFCGPSGGGKSTCISLLERFYDPVQGQVLLDGVDTKELNVHWLRSQIGLVGQEPVLFIGTIAENIAYGLDRTPTQEEIVEAAKMANAHDFVSQFPDGYETQVGMRGEQLSGGQKQRIAIARAILKNPNILLLDEATSALDSESEKIVQEALDKVVALKKRTTIIIAHRLSTIRKADKICVVSGGKIAEQGTHDELMRLNGLYARLGRRST